MNFEYQVVPIEQVSLDAENCRLHSPENLNFIKNSLEEFGIQKPIVVSKDYIIFAGNGTFLAAKELGYKQIPVVVSNLDIEKLKAYAIADNQIGLTSSWDLDKLSKQLQDIAVWNKEQNWQALGFDENSLKLMLSFDKDFSPSVDKNDFKESKKSTKNSSQSNSEGEEKYKPIKVDNSQREVIQMAIDKLRQQENDLTIPEGKCIELICAAYIS